MDKNAETFLREYEEIVRLYGLCFAAVPKITSLGTIGADLVLVKVNSSDSADEQKQTEE